MKTALVTGATGFIGGALARRLLADGWRVRAQTRHAENAADLARQGAQVVEADLRRPDSWPPVVDGADAAFHAAALVDVVKPDRDKILRVNVDGTRAVLQACLDAHVQRVVFLSSIAALGRQGMAMDESVEHDGDYATVYEETKHKADLVAREFARKGLDVVLVLPSVVIGPGDPKTTRAFAAFLRGRVPALPRAQGHLNMVHVDDLVDGILLAHEHGKAGERYIFNQATWTTTQVVETMHRVGGAPVPPRVPLGLLLAAAALEEARAAVLRRPPRVSRAALRLLARQYGYSSRRARQELGWDPAPFDDRFRQTLEAIRMEVARHG